MSEEIEEPCPVCGSEERRESTGLLLCECPCPVATQVIRLKQALAKAETRISNQDYMLVNKRANLEAAEARNLALVAELTVCRAVMRRLRHVAERCLQRKPNAVLMTPGSVLRMLGPAREEDGSAG